VLFPTRLDQTVMGIEAGWFALIRNTSHFETLRAGKSTMTTKRHLSDYYTISRQQP
jgi:hypothetical protein